MNCTRTRILKLDQEVSPHPTSLVFDHVVLVRQPGRVRIFRVKMAAVLQKEALEHAFLDSPSLVVLELPL